MLAERQAGVGASREQVLSSIGFMSTLVEKSQAARRIETSGRPDLMEMQNRAHELIHQAEDAYRAEDFALSMRLLGDAAKLFFEAVKPLDIGKEKRQRDFDNRMASMEALLLAQRRIVADREKNSKEEEIGARSRR